MEDDDMIVIIVGDDTDNEESSHFPPIKIKEEILDETDGTMSTQNLEAEDEHAIIIKKEIKDETEQYLQAQLNDISSSFEVKQEDEDYVPTESEDDKRRYKLLRPCQRRSFVKDLREQYPELANDKDLLVCSLAEIMKNVKPPPLPQDYYVMNGIMFECIVCTAFSETIPAAGRHYQEKHGSRYLICFACGADFRSTTNLYKHEKRCSGADVEVVLRARAIAVGNKGRQRPFLKQARKFNPLRSLTAPKRNKFCCDDCPAEFNSRAALVSHLYLHNGLRPFRCSECPCAYTSQSALTRHLKQHSDVKFVCDHCGRPFKVKTALVSHLDTHLPFRKHVCVECGRRFAQKSALVLHIDGKHRNLPPPCACQLCPKRFARMTLLKDHMRKDHGMLLMTRKMFFKRLPTMTDTQIKHAKAILKTDEPFSNSQHIFPQYQTTPDVNEEFLSYIEKHCLFDQSESQVT